MKYQDVTESLFNLRSKKSKYHLDNVKKAYEYLSCPAKQFKSIHVAGTNGKGSVSLKIARALEFSGYRTALFISPHIFTFQERISINGKYISKKQVVSFYKKILYLQKKMNIYLSFFEITTLIAFLFFAKEKVDFAVIETGLGGKLDATNIITPILSVITTISLDHTNVLGNTIEKIAYEKAQIIKTGVPVVLGPKASLDLLIKEAVLKKCRIYRVNADEGFYDMQNVQIAKKAINIIGNSFLIKKEAVLQALKQRLPARFEIFEGLGPRAIIIDGAHNEEGFYALEKAMKIFFPKEKIRVILGFSLNKDATKCLRILSKFVGFIHIIQARYIKAMPSSKIKNILLKIKFYNFKLESNIKKAMPKLKNLAQKNNEVLLVCGSFYILDDIIKYLKIKK